MGLQQMEAWLEQAIYRRQDVLGDFAGRELIAIHGESMLLHCLEQNQVDVQDGLQLLHAVHAVERFLGKLRDRNCYFHVLWFASHEGLLANGCPPEATYADNTALHKLRLVRAVLVEHLRQHPEAVKSVCFASMDCEPYRQYLADNPPRMFVVSDRAANAEQNILTFQSIIFRLNTEGYTICATLFSAMEGMPFDKADCPSIPLPCWTNDTSIDPVAAFQDLRRMHSQQSSLRALLSVAALASLLQSNDTPAMRTRAARLLAHVVVLEACPLARRPTRRRPVADQDDVVFLNTFCELARTLLDRRPWADEDAVSAVDYDVYDLVDGRLWLAVQDRPFSPAMTARCHELVTSLTALCGIDVQGCLPDTLGPSVSESSSGDEAPRATRVGSLLPFSHPDFDEYLGSVAVTEDKDVEEEAEPFVPSVDYTPTPPNTKAPPQATPKEKVRMLRRNQRRMADMQAYASSLTNATGKVLEPEIVVTAPVNKKAQKVQKVQQVQKTQKTQKAQKAKTDRKKIAQDYKDTRAPDILARWRTAYGNLTKDGDPLARYLAATNYVKGLSPLERELVGADVMLHVCTVIGRCLAEDTNKLKSIAPDLTALLWTHVQELAKLPLSEEAVQIVQALCAAVGLDVGPLAADADTSGSDGHALLSKAEAQRVVSKLTGGGQKRPALLPAAAASPLGAEFQLEYCGPYLERGFDAQADARVAGFAPDGWQRQVLDTIDARQSLFVVAPTSAGKTFISFYAMKQVLQASHDGVLVYVAPTKALVNQVAAEIQARFTKAAASSSSSGGGSGGTSVWAVLTNDYRINNPTGCQILVTVPKILQSLLLAPHSMAGKNPWPPRLRWIIFDEVHSIGQSDEGVVWEQLLMTAPCPLLALSATVGNPGPFQAWLADCEQAKGRSLRTITHAARYSDLRSYVWTPPPPAAGSASASASAFSGFFVPTKSIVHNRRWPVPGLEADGWNEDAPFAYVHPVAGLVDRSRTTLDDIGFEPRDCLLLWRALARHATDAFPVDPALAPAVFFAETAAVVKARVAAWEARLKAILLCWLQDRRSPFPAVLQDLSPACLSATETSPPPPQPTEQAFSEGVLGLLADLQRRGGIPALLFLYDRAGCEQVLESVVAGLMAAEKTWKATSAQWQDTLAGFAKHEAATAAAARKQPKKTTKPARNGGGGGDGDEDGAPSKLDSLREAASATYSKWDSFDPDEALPAFSLADTTKLLVSERERLIADLSYIGLPAFVIEGLRRGVGAHHAGMNRKYRQTVEMLFRRGYLTVVVATGTLALGINMPCKTVVFLGDSSYLNALNYRQAGGRAGRRGFDILGNVVFYGFAAGRVRTVLSSRLPDLRGHFALTPSLVLRTCMLLHGTGRCAYARETVVRSLLAQTRVYMGSAAGDGGGAAAVAHHLRFGLEVLRRGGLLSARGVPRGLAALVGGGALAYAEDGAFALAALLRGGYFQEECAAAAAGANDSGNNNGGDSGNDNDEPELLRRLVLVLAHLFGRRACRRHGDRAWLETVVRPSASVVLLPALPAAAAALLRQHNARALATLQTYVASYVRQHLAGQPDRALPLTGVVVGHDHDHDDHDNDDVHDDNGNAGDSADSATPPLRSPFAALSGGTDAFASVQELCETVRAGVVLEAAAGAVPHLPLAPDETGGVPLNAYLYDFFRHGDLATLVRSNGIRAGDVWFVLQEFSVVLGAVVAGLAQLVDPAGAGAGPLAEDLATEDRLRGDDREGAPVLQETQQVVAAPVVCPKKPARKRAVVASWEDASSDEDDEDASKDDNAQPTGATDRARQDGLRAVLQAFVQIKEQFDDKFRKVWA